MAQPTTEQDMLLALEEILGEKRRAVLKDLFDTRANLEKEGRRLPVAFGWEKARDIAEIQGLIATVKGVGGQAKG